MHSTDAVLQGVEVAAVDEEVGEEDDVAPLGQSINDVMQIFGILDPLPLVHDWG